MANQERRTVNYETDLGTTVSIQILYDDSSDAAASAEARFTAGGFGSENLNCAATVSRRFLKPRYVDYEFEDGKRLGVIYKTPEAFSSAITGGASAAGGTPKRYFGEQYSICNEE